MGYLLLALAGLLVAAATGLVVARMATAQRARYMGEARRTREEEQAALMNTLAGGLAHEIRNPLSTISMNLQLLREDWGSPITEREQRSRKKLDVVLREVRRLEDILQEFLAFSAGHKLNLAPVGLNELAGELLDFLVPQADRANIRLRRNFSPALPRVQADANLLRGAVLNLLVNAQQAMPKGGEIEVSTEKNGTHAILRVRDTGDGIAPEHLDKIFHLYFSTKPGGTGLGLPMAKRIVEEHGGTVAVESRPGQGSLFTIRLPL